MAADWNLDLHRITLAREQTVIAWIKAAMRFFDPRFGIEQPVPSLNEADGETNAR